MDQIRQKLQKALSQTAKAKTALLLDHSLVDCKSVKKAMGELNELSKTLRSTLQELDKTAGSDTGPGREESQRKPAA